MRLVLDELLKTRHRHLWVITIGLPILAVGLGALNYLANPQALQRGWASLWSQATLFYGLFFMTLGIAVLAATVWRPEHRGHNWNLLMAAPQPAGRVIAAKIVVLALLVTLMQATTILAALIAGLAVGLTGAPPTELVLATLLTALPGAAVAAWQSLISMTIRNFAAPIGIAAASIVISFGAVASGSHTFTLLLPPALLTRTLSLGSTAMAGAGTLDTGTAATQAVASLVLTLLAWAASALLLRRIDIRS